MISTARTFTFLWLPLALILLYAPFSGPIDLYVSSLFFADNHFVSNSFFDAVFKFGVIPADSAFITALIICLLSFFKKKWKPFRSCSFLMIFTLIVGAGLIVHLVLKDHWGRPRPRQVVEFGGQQTFRPFYSPNFFNQPEPSKSFPCGHCSMGFYFFALMFVGRHLKNRKIEIASWALAIILGLLLSVTRIAQGGHFLSDTIMTAIIMWYTALFFNRLSF